MFRIIKLQSNLILINVMESNFRMLFIASFGYHIKSKLDIFFDSTEQKYIRFSQVSVWEVCRKVRRLPSKLSFLFSDFHEILLNVVREIIQIAVEHELLFIEYKIQTQTGEKNKFTHCIT